MNNTKMKGCHPGGDKGLKGPDGMNTFLSYLAGRDDMKTIIRAEIEKRFSDNLEAEEKCETGYFGAAAKEDYDLLSFLDTLQEQEVKEQKSQDTVGRVSIEIRSNLQTDEVVRKTLIMLVNDGRISVTGAITSSDILNWLEGSKSRI